MTLLSAFLFFFIVPSETNTTMFFFQKTPKNISINIQSNKSSYQIGDTIKIKVELTNQAKCKQKFCTYMTPFECFKANIFSCIHQDDGTLDYQGKMVKRSKPSKKDFTKINASQTLTTNIILNEAYPITKLGQYSLQFKGHSINGLPDSNILQFIVE